MTVVSPTSCLVEVTWCQVLGCSTQPFFTLTDQSVFGCYSLSGIGHLWDKTRMVSYRELQGCLKHMISLSNWVLHHAVP